MLSIRYMHEYSFTTQCSKVLRNWVLVLWRSVEFYKFHLKYLEQRGEELRGANHFRVMGHFLSPSSPSLFPQSQVAFFGIVNSLMFTSLDYFFQGLYLVGRGRTKNPISNISIGFANLRRIIEALSCQHYSSYAIHLVKPHFCKRSMHFFQSDLIYHLIMELQLPPCLPIPFRHVKFLPIYETSNSFPLQKIGCAWTAKTLFLIRQLPLRFSKGKRLHPDQQELQLKVEDEGRTLGQHHNHYQGAKPGHKTPQKQNEPNYSFPEDILVLVKYPLFPWKTRDIQTVYPSKKKG